MSSLNKVILIGNLGNDPEIRKTSDGKEIASFSLATSRNWKDKNSGEKKKETEWHKIVVFNESLIPVIKNYIKKGSKLYLEGSLQTRKWQDQSGQDKYTTEIVLNYGAQLVLLDAKEGSDSSFEAYGKNTQEDSSRKTFDVDNEVDDDIPF